MTAVMAGLGLDALATTKDYDEGLLLSITNQLGSVQEVDGRVVYVADEDCLACLGDMARFLRRDNPKTREVVLALSAWNVMRAHIVPIILQYNKEHEMLLAATKARFAQCQDSRQALLKSLLRLPSSAGPACCSTCRIHCNVYEVQADLQQSLACSLIALPVVLFSLRRLRSS